MAYLYAAIANRIIEHLKRAPGDKLVNIVEPLGIGRHTVTRALKVECGCTFKALRKRVMAEAIANAARDTGAASVKEVAVRLGFSGSRALARAARSSWAAPFGQLRKSRLTGESSQSLSPSGESVRD